MGILASCLSVKTEYVGCCSGFENYLAIKI
jgi:hypothetical protein